MPPKVSVIMPAYNAAAFIGKSIEAVLNQNFADFELIVADDGSTDNTFEIANSFKDPRVKVYRKENGGAASARNFGLKHAVGKYIAYCDADDRFTQGHLKLLADYLDEHIEVGMVYSKAVKVEVDGRQTAGGWGFEFDRTRMEYFCLMVPSIVMHRRECLEKAGWWDEAPELRNVHEDWDFFLRICDHYKVAFINVPSVMWLKLPEGLFLKSLKNRTYYWGLDYVIKKRLAWFSDKKRNSIIAPFDGYFFYQFKTCSDLANLGEKIGAFTSEEAYDQHVIPMFESYAEIDHENLEVWLVLALVYFMRGKSAKVVEVAHRAKHLLGQPLKIEEKEISNLAVSSLKGIAFELDNADEKELAQRFLEKFNDFC